MKSALLGTSGAHSDGQNDAPHSCACCLFCFPLFAVFTEAEIRASLVFQLSKLSSLLIKVGMITLVVVASGRALLCDACRAILVAQMTTAPLLLPWGLPTALVACVATFAFTSSVW